MHSPLVMKIEVTKRSKVRRNYLTYMRARTGKAARLTGVAFDKAVNELPEDPAIAAAYQKLKDEAAAEHAAAEATKAAAEAETEAKVEAAVASHDEA